MQRTIVLGMCVYVVLGAWACSGDDDAGADGAGGSGAGAGDGSSAGDGAGAGNGSGSGAGNGSGTGTGDGGSDTGDGGVGTDTGGTSGGTAGTTASDPNALLLCGGELCACADGADNDDDGVMDGFDVECTGPYDDDEGSFATGISGDNVDPKWQDCFFDGNSGAGNDGCRYHTDCLTGDLPQDDPDCSVADDCVEFCGSRTPPGCDCFGCCTVATEDGPIDVITGTDCDSDDFSACTQCVKSVDCDNECGECELCTGVTVDDLPDECFEDNPPTAGAGGAGGAGGSSGAGGSGGAGGSDSEDPPPVYVCDGDAQLCRAQDECPPGYYCQFGCCRIIAPE